MSSSKPAVISQPVTHSEGQSYSVSYRRDSKPVDSRRFDSIRDRLNLSDRQERDIAQAKRDVAGRQDWLRSEDTRAQDKLARCNGRCDKERRKADEARGNLNAFDQEREFSRRLSDILSDQQKSAFDSGRER